MDEDLKQVLKEAQDGIIEDRMPTEDQMKSLQAYHGTTNNSDCPCGSGKSFQECCKRDYIALGRAVKGMKREQHEGKKVEHRREAAEQRAVDKADVVCRILLTNQGPMVDLGESDERWQRTHPFELASVILGVYHNLMCEAVVANIQGACSKLYSMVTEGNGAPPPGPRPPLKVAR
jgi:hypothetical protein